LLPVRAEIRELILSHAGEAALDTAGRKLGMQSLQQSGLAKVAAGETTLEEVLRVTRAI
jgi:type II secretory ATPase GspE/PulE/Tfp pilus assembly ATPase PilB-like protein